MPKICSLDHTHPCSGCRSRGRIGISSAEPRRIPGNSCSGCADFADKTDWISCAHTTPPVRKVFEMQALRPNRMQVLSLGVAATMWLMSVATGSAQPPHTPQLPQPQSFQPQPPQVYPPQTPQAFPPQLPRPQAPQPRTILWGNQVEREVRHFGIIGEVSQPGAYSASSDTTLQALISAAGGLSPSASPAVRVIRSDRSGYSLFYTPGGHDLLNPGDFVLVDPSRTQPVAARNPNGQAAGVWIGLVGIAPRPVVVPMEPGWAQLATILQALNQSPQLAQSARMIFPHRGGTAPDRHGPLPSGTIIALPASQVVQANLPEFPAVRPIADTQPPAGSPFVVTAGTAPPQEADYTPPSNTVPAPPGVTGQSAPFTPPHNTPQRFERYPAANADAAADRLPIPTPSDLPLPSAPYVSDREVPATMLPFSNGEPSEVSANPASMPIPGTRLATALTPPARETNPQRAASSTEGGKIQRPIVTVLPDDEPSNSDFGGAEIAGEFDELTESEPAGFSLWQMLAITGTVASLVGVAIGTRKYLEHQTLPMSESTGFTSRRSSIERQFENQAAEFEDDPDLPEPPRPVAVDPHESLSALVNGRLEVQEEVVEFPRDIRLQGRVEERFEVRESVWRVDAAASEMPPRPHLAPVRQAPVEPTAETPHLSFDPPVQASVPRPHFRTVAEQMLGRRRSGTSETPEPEAPAATPLVTAPATSAPAATMPPSPPKKPPVIAPVVSPPSANRDRSATSQPVSAIWSADIEADLAAKAALAAEARAARRASVPATESQLPIGKTPIERALSQLQGVQRRGQA